VNGAVLTPKVFPLNDSPPHGVPAGPPDSASYASKSRGSAGSASPVVSTGEVSGPPGSDDSPGITRASTTAFAAQADHGCLPAWRVAELPQPLPFSLTNVLRTIGPGAILLAGSIGAGEWIVGPLMAVQYGPQILWIATVGIVLQSIFNLEAVRYTMYTGEPILTGIMRLNPGPRLWAPVYIALGAAQLATPAVAAATANVLWSMWQHRGPLPEESGSVNLLGMAIILITAWLLLAGKSIERLLEKLSWFMIAFIFLFLVIINLWVVPWTTTARTVQGFLLPQPLPDQMDLVLLALFAATAGSGGLGNLAVSNWFRDKGFGMGQHVGGIGGALADHQQQLQPIGAVFEVNPDSRKSWHKWWLYARLDQQGLWAVGCWLGMLLNVNLVMAIAPGMGTISSAEAGVMQARYLADSVWAPLWWLALINGFWILFSTHLGNTDVLVRTVCDVLWAASPRVRRYPASRVYAALLGILLIWALIAIHLGSVLNLFKVLGIVASPIMSLAAIQILRVNTRFLPPDLRPAWWRQVGLVLVTVVYGGLTIALLKDAIW
jgi:hypothetical protein